MKIAMMGSGGIGGYFGARLAEAGEDVAFIARGPHLRAMREKGLRVESQLGDVHLAAVTASDDPAQIGPVDCVIFGVKSWDSEDAARAALPMIGPATVVVSLQNGVEAAAAIAPVIGRQHLIGGIAFNAAAIAEPGVIRHVGTLARIVIGEIDGRSSDRAEALAAACRRAGIAGEASEDIVRAIWEKFVFLVGLSATTCFYRQSIGSVREDPERRTMLVDVMAETVAVGRAKGAELSPGYADDRLAFIDGLPAEMGASMLHDLEAGNRLELDWLSGAVVRMGEELGIATPANSAVYEALAPYREGRGA